jgi:methyl-CpG-binding domain protein 4
MPEADSPSDVGAMGLEAAAAPTASPSKRPFMEMLQDSMLQRRQARLSGTSPLAELLDAPAAKRRRAAAASPARPASASARGGSASASEPDADPRAVLWEPPVSPYGLLEEEEELWKDPWKLLVACMLLNKTTAAQVRRVIWRLFELCPTPEAAAAADTAAIEALIQPLGLFRRRAAAVQRLSAEYGLSKASWRDPRELYGVGDYAAQAYWIFCRGRWRDVQPADKDLRRYRDWLEATDGLGSGLERGPAAVSAAAGAAATG